MLRKKIIKDYISVLERTIDFTILLIVLRRLYIIYNYPNGLVLIFLTIMITDRNKCKIYKETLKKTT